MRPQIKKTSTEGQPGSSGRYRNSARQRPFGSSRHRRQTDRHYCVIARHWLGLFI